MFGKQPRPSTVNSNGRMPSHARASAAAISAARLAGELAGVRREADGHKADAFQAAAVQRPRLGRGVEAFGGYAFGSARNDRPLGVPAERASDKNSFASETRLEKGLSTKVGIFALINGIAGLRWYFPSR